MNWFGDLIQENIEETNTVLDLGCGVMQGILDIVPTYPKTRLKCKKLVGVDIYKPYLDFLNNLGIETVLWDLTEVPFPFEDKSYDVVLLMDILEHLKKWTEVMHLINEAIRIARKKVFIITPSLFFENKEGQEYFPYSQFGDNTELLRHHLLIDKYYLRARGFDTIRIGKHRIAVAYLERGNFNIIRKRIFILRANDLVNNICLRIGKFLRK